MASTKERMRMRRNHCSEDARSFNAQGDDEGRHQNTGWGEIAMAMTDQFFAELCRRTTADRTTDVDARAMGGALGIDRGGVQAIMRSLATSGLIDDRSDAGMLAIRLTATGAAACPLASPALGGKTARS